MAAAQTAPAGDAEEQTSVTTGDAEEQTSADATTSGEEVTAVTTSGDGDVAGTTVTERAGVRPARSSARAKTSAALLAAVGAGVILLTVGRGWAHGDVTTPITFRVTATGSQLTGVPYGLGLAGLAGALALFAVRRIGRYLVGVVLALAGAGTVYAVADRLSRLDEALRTQAGTLGLGSDAKFIDVDNTLWPYLTIIGGVLLCLAGLYTLARGRSWSGLGNRYEAPAAAASAADVEAKPAAEVTARDLWDAQGRGADLTQ